MDHHGYGPPRVLGSGHPRVLGSGHPRVLGSGSGSGHPRVLGSGSGHPRVLVLVIHGFGHPTGWSPRVWSPHGLVTPNG